MSIAEKLTQIAENIPLVYAAGQAAGALMEVHKITIASDLTSGYNALLTGNEFARKHLTDDGFYIQLISLTPIQVGTNSVCYSFNSNRPFMRTKTPTDIYGVTHFVTTTTFNSSVATVNAQTSGQNLYATEQGDVKIHCSGNVVLASGEYMLILGVAEV